jgi:hypothetical protein
MYVKKSLLLKTIQQEAFAYPFKYILHFQAKLFTDFRDGQSLICYTLIIKIVNSCFMRLIVLTVILLYRITLFGDGPSPAKRKVWIHAVFLTTGLFIGGVSLVFIMSRFILLGTFHPRMLIFISPFIVWGVLYRWQMRLYKKKQQISYLIVTTPILICFAILAFFFYLRFL